MSYKKFVIYDIDESLLKQETENIYFNAKTKYAPCKGCFDCWLKTPGTCILKDKVYGLADNLIRSDKFIIISKCLYGGFSREVKGVVDRLIAFNLPFFKKLNNELHHTTRYDKKLDVEVYFYGDINDKEKETAKTYIDSVALNFNASKITVNFIDNIANIGGLI